MAKRRMFVYTMEDGVSFEKGEDVGGRISGKTERAQGIYTSG
jgi:hypothetical protein